MPSREDTSHSEAYAAPEHLRIGMYIHLDLPWFRHPFTLSSFKISSEKQIQDLRALKKQQFRYDTSLSEGRQPGEPDSELSRAAAPATIPSPIVNTIIAPPEADPIVEVESTPESTHVSISPITAAPSAIATNTATHSTSPAAPVEIRVQQRQAHVDEVSRAEKSFAKATGIAHRLDSHLIASPTATLREMEDLVGQMATVFLHNPDVTLHVMGENCGGEEVYHHSLNVTVLSMMLAKGLNLSAEQTRLLGSGALLHDIGLLKLPKYLLTTSKSARTAPEQKVYESHTLKGEKFGELLALAPEMRSIIAQHHELADGSGYPLGLKLVQITPLARIVSLTNFYDGLCNPENFTDALSPHEALAFIFARLRSKFDEQVLQVMIRALGVYPPGSLVKLSNDAIGIVTSVNPHKALRPRVKLYDPLVPKEAAVTLDLDIDTDVSISKSIRPAMVSPGVVAYLSPRRRITYFFDCGVLCEKPGAEPGGDANNMSRRPSFGSGYESMKTSSQVSTPKMSAPKMPAAK